MSHGSIWMFPKIVGFPPKSSNFNRVFHYKPPHFGVFPPIFGNTSLGSIWISPSMENPPRGGMAPAFPHFSARKEAEFETKASTVWSKTLWFTPRKEWRFALKKKTREYPWNMIPGSSRYGKFLHFGDFFVEQAQLLTQLEDPGMIVVSWKWF